MSERAGGLGAKLKELRRMSRMTQEQVVDKIQESGGFLSQSTLSKLERGDVDPPSITQLNDLAVAYGMQVVQLMQYLDLTQDDPRENDQDREDVLIAQFLKNYPEARSVLAKFLDDTKDIPHTIEELEEVMEIAASIIVGRQQRTKEQPDSGAGRSKPTRMAK